MFISFNIFIYLNIFNKTCKILSDRYYAAPRLIINSSTAPDNIVKFFKPLFDIGLSDKDCFEIIDNSKILSGSKYSTNRKRFNRNSKNTTILINNC